MYERAVDKIVILENSDLKKELTNKLIPVLEKIKADEKRREAINGGISIVIIIGLIILYRYVYNQYKHKYDYLFNQEYLRHFPDESSPSQVSYLFHKKITNDAVSAEILNLINNNVIIYEKNSDRKNDYYLKRNNNYIGFLTYKEEMLLKLIFNTRSSVSIYEMKKEARKSHESFYRRWKSFSSAAISEGKNAGFYNNENSNNNTFWVGLVLILLGLIFLFVGLTGLILLIVGIVMLYKSRKGFKENLLKNIVCIVSIVAILGSVVLTIANLVYNHIYHFSTWLNLLCLVVSIIVGCMTVCLNYRSLKGEETIRKWKALKNFMENFGNMEDKELPEVHLWEKYLVYALVLDCADRLSNIMELKLSEMNIVQNNIITINYRDLYKLNKVISKSVCSSVNAATSAHNASVSSSGRSSGGFSSGSGGGGGFSSGGGGGGGGGGGRF